MNGVIQSLPLLPLVVGLPLIAAISTILISSRYWQARVSGVFAGLLLSVVVLITVYAQEENGYPRYTLGGWAAPLGIDLIVDGLSLALLALTAVLIVILSIYSKHYFFDSNKHRQFWPLWWFLVSGLNAAFVAADAFNIYVALEMIGMSAVALVTLAGTREATAAALRYALVGLLGSLCYLLGVALLYRAHGTLDLEHLATLSQGDAIGWAALSLISVGLLLKTALLPMHFWLPPAHANAPAPVSAVLSALVVKASFYLLIRFWLEVLAPSVTTIAVNLLGVLGAVAIFWGSFEAYRAQRLKLLVAYSTVAQLGYLFLVFPLAFSANPENGLSKAALIAVTYFILAHALAKAAMFLAAGNILARFGQDNIEDLPRFIKLTPLDLVTFIIAGVSLIGLPPTGGFIAKWLLLNSAIDNGQWWWILVMLGGGLTAAIYIGRVVSIAFRQPNNEPVLALPNKENPSYVTLSSCGLILAIATVALGFSAESVIGLIEGSLRIHLGQEGAF